MTRPTASAGSAPASARGSGLGGDAGGPPPPLTCTACPLLCDDVRFTTAGDVDRACDAGRAALLAALEPEPAGAPSARDATGPLDRQAAIARAALLLVSARRVLVTGLAAATLEGVAAACDLAETLAAAVDAGGPDVAQAAGPTIARIGAVTASWEELRDRADLVVFWHCDPADSHPRFLERFVRAPLACGRHRFTIAVGSRPVLEPQPHHRHLPLPDAAAVEAARCLHVRLLGGMAGDAAIASACTALNEAVAAAACVAFVTRSGRDCVGLEPWSMAALVRSLAHEKAAFEVPLGAGLVGPGPDVAGAAAVCTWRYGAAGAITRADRLGGGFAAAEGDARRLVARGEVDAVLMLGPPREPLAAVLRGHDDPPAVVRIESGSDAVPTGLPSPALRGQDIAIRCAPIAAVGGTMLREDGREMPLQRFATASAPAVVDVLEELHQAVRHAMTARERGATR